MEPIPIVSLWLSKDIINAEPRCTFCHINHDVFKPSAYPRVLLRGRAYLSCCCFAKISILTGQPNQQASWICGPARPLWISAKNCIFPLVQQGQTVMSVKSLTSIVFGAKQGLINFGSSRSFYILPCQPLV